MSSSNRESALGSPDAAHPPLTNSSSSSSRTDARGEERDEGAAGGGGNASFSASASSHAQQPSTPPPASSSSSSAGPSSSRRDFGGVQNVVVMEGVEDSESAGGPGPVYVDMGEEEEDDDDDDEEEREEEDLDDYREDLVDIVAESNEDSDAVSTDEDVGGSETEPTEDVDDPEETGEFNKPKEGEALIGCKHYRRRCALVCVTCQKPYTCRFCHDEAEFKHELDRKSVVQIQCLECRLTQQVQRRCEGCDVEFALYFCSICRLYDDEDKKQYHCEGCKICRIGGRENFFHCQTCDMCLANDMRNNHKCIEKMSRSNCPVCLEDLHTSRKACRVPKCGHMLHFKCMQQLLKTGNYACPTCSVSMVDMSSVWEKLDFEVNLTPMPAEYRDLKVQILCRDCHAESRSSFHILGQKCTQCGSYNTCRTADPGGCSVEDEETMEAREHQQAEAEDAAAAAVRELGLAGNMRDNEAGEDEDDDDDVDDDERHYDSIRGLIHSLAAASSSRRQSRLRGSGNDDDANVPSGSSSGGDASGASNSSSSNGVASGSNDGSNNDNSGGGGRGGRSGGDDERPSGAAAMAPLYRDFEDDDLD